MFTLYSADYVSAPSNCSYPRKIEVTDIASFADAVKKDYVCAEYMNSYRNNDNFIGSDCLPVDCDNDHSEDPADGLCSTDGGSGGIGKVYQEALIIAYGEGSNGKSTFWNAIAKVLGSYSGSMSADALTVGCKRNVKPEMAELKGKRLVIAAELEEGMRLNTSIVKQLCSTDVFVLDIMREDMQHDDVRLQSAISE